MPLEAQHLGELLGRLPQQHRTALEWFRSHAGQRKRWPAPLPGNVQLATKAKGIYKPSWSEYALSVRQTIGGPYPDRDPTIRPDGTWSYLYYQEGDDPASRDSYYTNRGLMACMRDHVPVGVMRQVKSSSPVEYEVLGIALVDGWDAGYFRFKGLAQATWSVTAAERSELNSQAGTASVPSDVGSLQDFLTTVRQSLEADVRNPFNPQDITDARQRIATMTVRRWGQPEFRKALRQAYADRCSISAADHAFVLEAAHIIPYLGPSTNHVSNGLLLRADIHTLFDLGMITIDTESMTVRLHSSLQDTVYREFSGKALRLPADRSDWPNKHALDLHRGWAGW